MKKKAFNKKLKLQKENIVNLNQLNMIKGGVKATSDCVPTNNCSVTALSYSADPVLEGDLV